MANLFHLALTGLVILFLAVGCTPKRPVLYPNEKLQSVTREQADADIDACIQMAKEYGAEQNKGAKVAGSTAGGAAIGAAGSAVWAAVMGRDVGSRAAAGAAAGATTGFIAGATSVSDDPLLRNFVNKCLTKKGYEPAGWK